MIRRTSIVAALAIALAATAGCGSLFDVNLFVVGEQTALEKQVLGTYSALGEDLLVYSSVRGVDPEGNLKTPPPATDSQKAALAAMREREYNRDDIDALLVAGIVGEGIDGMLVSRPEPHGPVAIAPEEAARAVEEENAARAVVLGRLVETSGVAATDSAAVAAIFAGINRDAAPRDAWVQRPGGEWVRK